MLWKRVRIGAVLAYGTAFLVLITGSELVALQGGWVRENRELHWNKMQLCTQMRSLESFSGSSGYHNQ